VLLSEAKTNTPSHSPRFEHTATSEGVAAAFSCATRDVYLLDLSGKIVARLPFGIEGFHDGVTVVREKWGRFGFIDKTFALLGPMQFEGAESFHEGVAVVKLRGKHAFVEKRPYVVSCGRRGPTSRGCRTSRRTRIPCPGRSRPA
jgi:hypothetical protein